jgi:tetratricopeptide (TPR) repeat protein
MGLIVEQQKYKEAEEKFREAYRAQKRNTDTILNLIVVLQEQGKYEEALQFCNEGLALEPTNLEFLLNRSHCLIKTKRYQEAIQDCDKVLNMDEDNTLAYYNKGCAKALISSEYEAVPLIQKAIFLDNTFKEKAKGDPDLTGLKQNNDFKKLIE